MKKQSKKKPATKARAARPTTVRSARKTPQAKPKRSTTWGQVRRTVAEALGQGQASGGRQGRGKPSGPQGQASGQALRASQGQAGQAGAGPQPSALSPQGQQAPPKYSAPWRAGIDW